jgi:uncharacterized protein
VAKVSNRELIEFARRRLESAAPGAEVILFGSRARGDESPDSDLDLLVIEPDEVIDREAETARLRRELRGYEVSLDVIVIDARQAEEWKDVKGTVLYDALHEGRVLVES